MSNKYFSGRKGRYIFCDLCGQAVYADEAIKLTSLSGRPGLIVCQGDADSIDYGLIPYVVTTEKAVQFIRIAHQNVENGTTPLDYETTTGLGS